jgi:hypothetical protein
MLPNNAALHNNSTGQNSGGQLHENCAKLMTWNRSPQHHIILYRGHFHHGTTSTLTLYQFDIYAVAYIDLPYIGLS